MMSFRLKVLPIAVAQALATGAFSAFAIAPAMAQQADVDAQAVQPVQRVEITGSNIRRADAETPSPVQVISADDLKNSGYTSVADVLQHITADGAGALIQSFRDGFASGGGGISLHGLNDNATLVLIDGHRMASYPLADDGQRSFVDLSNIPFDTVERIEILKDGASAVYGSDAIAGVVNIILKKNIVGTTVSAEAGTATEGGGTTAHATVTHGTGKLDTDGYNAYISLEYRHQDPIDYSQRQGDGQWQSLNWAPYGGVNTTPGVITPQNPRPSTLTPYLTNPNVPFSGATNSSAFFPGACSSYTQLASGGCAYQSRDEIQSKVQNVNVLASLTKKLSEDWTLDLKASMFQSQDALPGNGYVSYPSSSGQLIAISSGVLPHFVGTAIPAVTVPANYPGNPFGVPAIVNGVIPGAPLPGVQTDAKAFRAVADLSGTLGAWDIDTSLGYTKVNLSQDIYGSMNVPALNAALNRTNNPFSITGPNTAADMAAIFPAVSAFDTSELDFAELHASRSLAQLPGGDFAISTGGQYIRRVVNSPAALLAAEGVVSGNTAYAFGTQTDSAAYIEFAAPVLKSLELDGAVRYDYINNTGSATTPKIAFKFTPTDAFALRGTLSQGFRAPAATENGNAANIGGSGNMNDPVLCPGGIPTSGNIAKGSVIAGCNMSTVYLNTTNPNLSPEKSTSATLGAILEPIKGWSTTVDLYQITIRDQIISGTSSANPVRAAPVQTLCADGNGGSYTCTPSVGLIAYFPNPYINANQTETKGLEFDTRYKFNLGDAGKLTSDFQLTHAFSYIQTVGGVAYELAGTHGPTDIGANTGNPKGKAQLSFTWDKGPLEIATIFHWTSSFDLTDTSYQVDNCAEGGAFYGKFPAGNIPAQYCKVDSFVETDLTARYKVNKQWTLHASITNLFNQSPPIDMISYSNGPSTNLVMHSAGAVGRFINAGAVYSF